MSERANRRLGAEIARLRHAHPRRAEQARIASDPDAAPRFYGDGKH